jgi:hypothetical protein
MANAFPKEVHVMFEQVLDGFDDWLVISKAVNKFNVPSDQTMERSNDRIWRPIPFQATSFSGFDQTGNFGDMTELAVPVGLGNHRAVPRQITSKNLRDKSRLDQFGLAAKQKLASDINDAVFNNVVAFGTKFSKRTAAASGFDDVAALDTLFNNVGVPMTDRTALYSSAEYNLMASNLASRSLYPGSLPVTAYEKAMVSEDISGFRILKNDQVRRVNAATATGVVVNGANQYYVPSAVTLDAAGNPTNVDNRYQTLAITVGASTVKVGDRFTIAGVNSVHNITKQDTGNLQTFTITAILTGAGGSGNVQISPPIVSGGGGSRAELDYQNCTATPANSAAITFLNTVTANVAPFFIREAVEIIPGSFAIDPEDGWSVLRGTTDFGIPITFAMQGNINDLTVKVRWDIDFGVGVLLPEMCGIQMFNQT